MAEPRLMPKGKQQFGVIIDIGLHQQARREAADKMVKISDIYASALAEHFDNVRLGSTHDEVTIARQLSSLKENRKEIADLIKALVAMGMDETREVPQDTLAMLKFILDQYLVRKEEASKDDAKRKMA